MKKQEIEQRIEECWYRISKLETKIVGIEDYISCTENDNNSMSMDKVIAELKNETNLIKQIICELDENGYIQRKEVYEIIDERINQFSKQIYTYVDEQDQRAIAHTNFTRDDLANRIQNLSDGIYGHVSQHIDRFDEEISTIKDLLKK